MTAASRAADGNYWWISIIAVTAAAGRGLIEFHRRGRCCWVPKVLCLTAYAFIRKGGGTRHDPFPSRNVVGPIGLYAAWFNQRSAARPEVAAALELAAALIFFLAASHSLCQENRIPRTLEEVRKFFVRGTGVGMKRALARRVNRRGCVVHARVRQAVPWLFAGINGTRQRLSVEAGSTTFSI